ncbi:MAG: hypothetical protein K8T25_10805 [Planctomycetia bacterium]|nr:hypothetical protein [Planctomycetia bacterium]
MSSHRRVVIAAILLSVVAWPCRGSAEDSWLGKLNPFASKTEPAKSTKTFPGFSNPKKTATKKPAQKSMVGKTYDSVAGGTKTAWNKTTDFLSPKHLFSSSSTPQKKMSSPQDPKTVGEWLKQKPVMP